MIFIGVYIGSYAVKAVAIQKVNKVCNVLQTHFLSVAADTPEEQKNLIIINHLKTLADLYKTKDVKYIFCLSQNAISTEIVSFPFTERYKVLKSLPFEMEEKLSLFDYTKMISDIKPINPTYKQNNLLVFSCFKSNISNLLTEIKSIGITPFIITCEASAIANLFETTKTPIANNLEQKNSTSKKKCLVYLKIGHVHSMAMIFYKDRLQNVYSFEWGTTSCIKQLAIKYELPFSKAMKQFYDNGLITTPQKGYTKNQIEFSQVIQTEFENLIDKLRFLLLQIEGENIYTCEKIIICGGGAQVKNLHILLSQYLNVPVVRAESPVNFPTWNLKNNDAQQNNLMTALGAAMEGLKKPNKPAINFLKNEFTVKFNPFSRWKQPMVIGISTFIMFSAYAILKNHQTQKISKKINNVFQKQSMQILKLKRNKISIKRVQRFIDSKKQLAQLDQLNSALLKVPSAIDKIKDLTVLIKKQPNWNLKIQRLNIIGNKIEIKGIITFDYIKTFKKNLVSIAVAGSLTNLDTTQKDINPLQKKSKTTINTKSPKESKNNTVSFNYSFIQKQG